MFKVFKNSLFNIKKFYLIIKREYLRVRWPQGKPLRNLFIASVVMMIVCSIIFFSFGYGIGKLWKVWGITN